MQQIENKRNSINLFIVLGRSPLTRSIFRFVLIHEVKRHIAGRELFLRVRAHVEALRDQAQSRRLGRRSDLREILRRVVRSLQGRQDLHQGLVGR